MTTTASADLSRAPAARGWRYGPDEEELISKSGLVVEWEELFAAVPDMTPHELAAWQEAQWIELLRRRKPK
jgi:hypothetical protein